MKKRIFRFLIGIAYLFSCLTGCAAVHDAAPERSPYLNITESYFTDETMEDMESICIVYDIGEKKLHAKGAALSGGEAFPIVSYSSANYSIFFSAAREEGDQLYRYRSGEEERLTDEFAALTYIFQCGNQLFLSAQFLGNNLLEPVLFDWEDNTIKRVYPDAMDDRFVRTATCDPAAKKVYFSYSSDAERRKASDDENGDVWHAPSTICSLDVQSGKVKTVYQTKDYIWGMAVSGNMLYYCGAAGPFSERTCYAVDLETEEKTELPLSVSIRGDMAVWDNVLYMVGLKDGIRGVYAMDLSDLHMDLIYKSQPDGQSIINGMSLNY
ncbi:MAG: hypothetical protein Q4P20_07580 [Eubacteriales bacterium]|nr:hypothetical protein [Eubacteriales bacterium]